MVPKHSSWFRRRDYYPYVASRFSRRRYSELGIDQVWGEALPDRHLIPTPTGRHAWWYFLELADLEDGDEVLMPAYNFYVMVRIAIQRNLKPVFVDIDPSTLTIDVEDLKRKITNRSRIVLVTHMFGISADLEAITSVCGDHDLLLFEDCAHAVGTLNRNRQVGQSGDGALFSFGIKKMINSFGGGLLAVSEEFHQRARDRNLAANKKRFGLHLDLLSRSVISYLSSPSIYGWTLYPGERISAKLSSWKLFNLKKLLDPSKDDSSYRFVEHGRAPFLPFMLRMHQVQLERLEQNIEGRRKVVASIKDRLDDGVETLDEDAHGRWNGSYFGIYVSDPEACAGELRRHGIGSDPHEFLDCSQLEQFSSFAATCENASYTCSHLLRLPSYPGISADQIGRIAGAINAYSKGTRA